jgi:mono/diheme cytochrome c family protein
MKRLYFAAVFIYALTTGCASARRSEPISGPLPEVSKEVGEGRLLFLKNCHQCHVHGEAGLGPAINDKPLPAFMIRMQVRNGLGAMPSFSEQDLGSGELDKLIAYIETLRDHG